MAGPLAGTRIVEMAGLGPGPFGAMMLADMGADVVRVERVAPRPDDDYHAQRDAADARKYVLHRGRRSLAVDLKHADGVETVLRLVERADALVEGFRPGVMERLGLGPDVCLGRNQRLVYGRITGWGQDGPLAATAGHDATYLALTGALHSFARHGERPLPPLAMVGDMGGGGLLLAFGIVCALREADRSGVGQVVDAAMIDGVAAMSAMWFGMMAQGRWRDEPGTNFTDPGAPHYDVYETSDHRFVAVAALEEPFYRELLATLGLEADDVPPRSDAARWPELTHRLATVFASRTRDEWAEVFAQGDACVAPVLSFSEAPGHPHHVARGTYLTADSAPGGVVQPRPAPRFSRTEATARVPPPLPGEHTDAVLHDWGFDDATVARLRAGGAIA